MIYTKERKDVYHSCQCINVEAYQYQYDEHENKANCSVELNDRVECPLCHLGITDVPDRISPTAAAVLELGMSDGRTEYRDVYSDSLRHLINRAEKPLQGLDALRENVGISVRSRGDWKTERRQTSDTSQFDQALMDGLETTFIFDLWYYGTCNGSWDDTIEAAIDGDYGMSPERHVAKTISWLTDHTDSIAAPIVKDILETYVAENTESEAEQTQTPESDNSAINPPQPAQDTTDADQSGLNEF